MWGKSRFRPKSAYSFRPRRRRAWRTLWVVPLLIVIAALLDPALIRPRGPLAAQPERIETRFTLCGPGRGNACVVDGDTFKLGTRRIRVTGIDAPELSGAACPAEAALGVRARDRLLVLLNAGPFDMVAHRLQRSDSYGRDLRVVQRGDQVIGDTLIDEGLAHGYFGSKESWC